jgi:hypothetical protein
LLIALDSDGFDVLTRSHPGTIRHIDDEWQSEYLLSMMLLMTTILRTIATAVLSLNPVFPFC